MTFSRLSKPVHSLTLLACAGCLSLFSGCMSDGEDGAVGQSGKDGNDAGVSGVVESTTVTAPTLVGRAVLPAVTYLPGPTCGYLVTSANGVDAPFYGRQPVQGMSGVLADPNDPGTYWTMSDNGFGTLTNSDDYLLRLYKIKPAFKTANGGSGKIEVLDSITLRDPNRKVPFTITNFFSAERALTGADFDIEAVQRAADGTLWFGDEFGPFLLHTSADGVVLEAPISLPDVDKPGKFIRAAENPLTEEASTVRIMQAMRAHARLHGGKTPVFSPYHVMLKDGNTANDHYARDAEAAAPKSVAAGLTPAASDIHDPAQLRSAGFKTVCYTVNTTERMNELFNLRDASSSATPKPTTIFGIISDRPDLLLAAVKAFDANGDGTPGDYLTADGLIDQAKFDAQGHRGGRNLRPENTLPAMEVALDNLMNTLELDCGITSDNRAVLSHDPYIEAAKSRKIVSGAEVSYTPADQVLIKDLTLDQIQSTYIADKVFRGDPQTNNRSLSPVAVAFATARSLKDPYVHPSLDQVFEFVDFYVTYYKTGAGKDTVDAAKKAKNAAQVRFNIETKVNPRSGVDAEKGIVYKERTKGPYTFATVIAELIVTKGLQERADIQSFDFRTLIYVQELFPAIRAVCLFGDFPIYPNRSNPDSDDSTNLQDEDGANTPWLAGMIWPYRKTTLDYPARASTSGGFEGMAISLDKTTLYPLLERPLKDPVITGQENSLVISPFLLATKTYAGTRYLYPLDAKGTNIGDFILTSATQGMVIERDGTQGDLNGFKKIFSITLNAAGQAVTKSETVNLIEIQDPKLISAGGIAGDVGLATAATPKFAFPFVTIEDIILIDANTIGVLNDNNYPGSVGRHVGAGGASKRPDDNEFILIRLPPTAPKAPN